MDLERGVRCGARAYDSRRTSRCNRLHEILEFHRYFVIKVIFSILYQDKKVYIYIPASFVEN